MIVGSNATAIPNSVTSIGDRAFVGCAGIISLSIPNSVSKIGNNAFSYCLGLNTINIPKTISSIGNEAFTDCKSLNEFICYAIEVPKIGYGIFFGFNFSNLTNATLYVPAESIDKYKVAEQWKNFGSIKAIDGESNIANIDLSSVLVTSTGIALNISGVDNVNHIEFYNLSGSYLGAEPVINGEASFETDENLVIVKIGEKSIKVKK